MRTKSLYRIHIHEVDLAARQVKASWNNNPQRTYGEYSVRKWRLKEPMMIKSHFGSERLATRAEIKAAKATK